ncbi:hypothetical protein CLAFUW4_01016 [Fulvia fulva]|uniref:Uncharacterized protein n=1 Tax=Passalora fulva TaxID=5499 RepID=A0A9Q8L609_PASFU|nr:uncharacterized protein CLAFUR5_01022 [Fulvia fulva]KAK4634278.1 hypothetical protein CLAFUR4_01017 [Fulvia fulva]KAK4637081.1 hypothetical protein CLAFUR0_01018 [Fulvia fulva]UJO11525.1 hypothetical protein CLAFUR5_01022 [Fulvia fulva]WPV10223.1 hypothetical protein CLAFUW4_01016 [Fulvia fulva]WPV25221.1 hypothetical protein CLAFUW7_00800 [Fulvia fulva]
MRRFLDESDRFMFTPLTDQVDGPESWCCSSPSAGSAQLNGHAIFDPQADRRHPSPASSALKSSLTGSARSDCRDSSWASPELAIVSNLTLYGQEESVAFVHGGYLSYGEQGNGAIGDCVALHDVQRRADDQPSVSAFEGTDARYETYGSFAQEGYHPIASADDDTSETSHSVPYSQYCPTEEVPRRSSQVPDFRRRRTQSSRSISSSTARVNKRPQMNQRSSSYHHSPKSGTTDPRITTAGNRAFPCPLAVYGCPSTFGSKNEWKRHFSTQHMRLGFWRCDQCGSADTDRKQNDFNRKDLFIQHVRRMHAAETSRASTGRRSLARSSKGNEEDQVMAEIAKSCYQPLRSSPEHSGCLFCEQEFHGQGTWNDRMEHVGRHMDSEKKSNSSPTDPGDWRIDAMVQQWMTKVGIISSRGTQWLIN